MITFRYHVVSLVAVFLALGTGALVGSSFISRGTVAVLRRAHDTLDKRNRDLIRDVRELEKANETLTEFEAAVEPLVERGVLENRPIVLLSLETTPGAVVDQVAQSVLSAGGRLDGSFELSVRLDMSTEGRRQQVALALELDEDEQDQDDPVMAGLLVERLQASLSGRSPGMLQRLIDAGLATPLQVPGTDPMPPAMLAPPGSAILFVAGESARTSELEERLVIPLVRSLAGVDVLVGVGEAGSNPLRLVSALRQDSGLRVVTADGVDRPLGRAGLLLGLQAAASGKFGHYGSGPGASRLLPEVGPRP